MPTVDIEHGQTTYASTFAEPLAYGDFQSCASKSVTAVAGVAEEARQHLVTRKRRVAVQLGRKHFDPGRGSADPDVGAGTEKPLEDAPSRTARRTRP